MNTFFKTTLAVAALAISAFANANAAPAKKVAFADLDLSTQAGVTTLYSRIQNAAWKVCHDLIPAQNGPSAIENGKCRATLIDAAVAEVDRPMLTALHQKKAYGLTASR